MKKLSMLFWLTAAILILQNASAQAADTWWVRKDGGTITECDGTKDLAKSADKHCAVNHPWYLLFGKVKGGDTLMVDGANTSQYMYGYGAPNAEILTNCTVDWQYNCTVPPIPSGPDATHPTRILGKGFDSGCTNPPQLWGTGRTRAIINLAGTKNAEVQCFEVTDHSDCQLDGPAACPKDTPFGPYGENGLQGWDSENVLIRNVNIHGMSYRGVYAGRLKNWTLEKTKLNFNSFVGWDGDIGAFNSSDSGVMMFNQVQITYSGCGEKQSALGKPYNCYSQDQGGYGDGLGTHQTGGDWTFIDSDVSHNVSDGIDLLYHDNTGKITITRTRAEGNAGNQIKVATATTMDNSVAVGNCNYFQGQSFTSKTHANGSPVAFNNCRANGATIAAALAPGRQMVITNSTITGLGDVIIQTSGQDCNGSESFKLGNDIFLGGKDFTDPTDLSALHYASGATGNGDGPCGSFKFPQDPTSVIWSVKGGCLPGYICQDPKFVGPLSGDKWNLTLPANSPLAGKGANGGTTPPTDTTPPIISGVDVITNMKNATVVWTVNEKATGQTNFGTTNKLGTLSEKENGFLPFHSQELNGLKPGTHYFYQVMSADAAGNLAQSPILEFDTLPLPCTPDKDSDGKIICDAVPPDCDKTSIGRDTCGNDCSIVGDACQQQPQDMTIEGVIHIEYDKETGQLKAKTMPPILK